MLVMSLNFASETVGSNSNPSFAICWHRCHVKLLNVLRCAISFIKYHRAVVDAFIKFVKAKMCMDVPAN